MHATAVPTARRVVYHRAVGRTWPLALPHSPLLMALRADATGSPFAHFRFQTTKHGKLLAFRTGNTIRAGKSTHGDAALAAMCFQWWLHKTTMQAPPWPSGISCPNTVFTGQLKQTVSDEVRNDWTATSSPKFPGIALAVPDGDGCTPELFLKQGKFICPGVTTVPSLSKALNHITALAHRYPLK